MKIAYLCNFSYPFWEGIWNNVYHTAKYMIKKGHEVHVFCSNRNPAGKDFGPYENFEGIHIHRFPVKLKIGQYALFFDFEEELMKIRPDIIHTNVYRSPFSTKAVKIARKLDVPCFLTTHAPFERDRGFLLSKIVQLYDFAYGKRILNSYKKVIVITKWEQPYLLKLGCKKEKIEYIPNGVDENLFIRIDKKKNNHVIYLGRVSDIKNLELLVRAAKKLPEIKFEIIGPAEKGYSIKSESKNLNIIERKYNLQEEIEYFKKSDIYVLPSKSEGLPQTLLEAMAAGKIVIASQTWGAKEVINDGINGFLFKDVNELVEKIKYVYANFIKLNYVRKNAQNFAKTLGWNAIVRKIEKVYFEN